MIISHRSRYLAGSIIAVALLAGCESVPPETTPDEGVPCGATFPTAPDGTGDEVWYVAGQCPEAEAQGTEAHPFVHLSDALAKAGEGATILVSAGEYKENLLITRGVTIVGSSDPTDPDGSTLSLQAPEETAIRVVDTGVVLLGVRVESARGTGVLLEGGSLRMEGSVINDTGVGSAGIPATGMLAHASGTLILRNTRVTGTAGTGVLVSGASATFTDVEVRDSARAGIVLETALGEVVMTDTTVLGSAGAGVRLSSSHVTIENSAITGTTNDPDRNGDGILAMEAWGVDGTSLGPAELTVRNSVISGNGRTGILCGSGTRTLVLQKNTIEDNGLPGTASYKYVGGIWLQSGVGEDTASEISGNTLNGNKLAGILMIGETHGIHVFDNTISGTLTEDAYGDVMGDGFLLTGGASANIEGNTVDGSGRFGIMIDAAPTATTAISSNTIQNSAQYGIVLQNLADVIATDTNTYSANASGDVTTVVAGTYANPDRPLPF